MAIFSILACFFLVAYAKSVPPQVCFEPFNWQDCGRPPVHVLYYYKSGSRCEVGIWRGCLPNMNMFKDEYECVNTCVYIERVQPDDFHMMAGSDEFIDMAPEISVANETDFSLYPTSSIPPTRMASETASTTDNDTENYSKINSVEVNDTQKTGTTEGLENAVDVDQTRTTEGNENAVDVNQTGTTENAVDVNQTGTTTGTTEIAVDMNQTGTTTVTTENAVN